MYPELPLLRHTHTGNFLLIAGPCVVEDEESPFAIAERLLAIAERLHLPFAFKASYRKANRSRLDSFTGIGDQAALEVLGAVRERYGIPVVTDIHSEAEAAAAAPYADILQIPAFLCRQTELLRAAAATGRVVNIKKGQFLAPDAMIHAVDKMHAFGNDNVMLTERGTTFGYQDLVVDFRGVPQMRRIGVPVIVDITHSLQRPNQPSGVTGGDPGLIETIGRAAVAVGADGIFMETHPNPAVAKSDGANMLPLDKAEPLMETLLRIHRAARQPNQPFGA
ncbi:MAG: 2-dehydro-3-deoxyphosphooctonate aldolase (KDO 8-P synthase) [bacterium P3]|nr:MAG: 2-dehydro-3-deoxyphosphooctonate aldolase (KDO 8-P synthase) [bacterium P3]KWW32477.1 MAG: 2-dehydro-3-deoxyphosphooctonate aldolase (KDO 8-P synthase) [bacterium F083]